VQEPLFLGIKLLHINSRSGLRIIRWIKESMSEMCKWIYDRPKTLRLSIAGDHLFLVYDNFKE